MPRAAVVRARVLPSCCPANSALQDAKETTVGFSRSLLSDDISTTYMHLGQDRLAEGRRYFSILEPPAALQYHARETVPAIIPLCQRLPIVSSAATDDQRSSPTRLMFLPSQTPRAPQSMSELHVFLAAEI